METGTRIHSGWKKWVLNGVSIPIMLAFIAALIWVAPASADIAPPDSVPGANLAPSLETTQVRMLSEKVVMTIIPTSDLQASVQSQVVADFTMRNLSTTTESMDVRFPLSFWDGASNDFEKYPHIAKLDVQVDNSAVTTHQVNISTTAPGGSVVNVPWSAFRVNFPPGKDVHVEVAYSVYGQQQAPAVRFKYILETGAGWKGDIGSVDFTVRLPYFPTEQNVDYKGEYGLGETTAKSYVVQNDLRWHFYNLEPTSAKDDLYVTLVMPAYWKTYQDQLANTKANPKNGESWGQLGRISNEIISLKHGLRADTAGVKLYKQADAAYNQAVTLLPKDPSWHYEYADLLYNHYFWTQFQVNKADMTDLVKAANELRNSLELDPNSEKARSLADEFSVFGPDVVAAKGNKYDFLVLTATPATPPMLENVPPTPTATLQPTPQPTSTPAEQIQLPLVQASGNTPSPTPKKSGGLPFCGAAIAPLMLVLWYAWRSKPNK
jgi:hypothetical protein